MIAVTVRLSENCLLDPNMRGGGEHYLVMGEITCSAVLVVERVGGVRDVLFTCWAVNMIDVQGRKATGEEGLYNVFAFIGATLLCIAMYVSIDSFPLPCVILLSHLINILFVSACYTSEQRVSALP